MGDIRLWLDSDKKVCAERRYFRKSRGGPGEKFEQFREFYDELVWSNYLKHKDVQLANAADPLRLDSQVSAEALADIAESHLRDELKDDPRKLSTEAFADATESEPLAGGGYSLATATVQKSARRRARK